MSKGFITTLIFLIIICLPLIFQTLDFEIKGTASENRQLAPLPAFDLKETKNAKSFISAVKGVYHDTKKFKDEYNKYYQDNFVFKDILFDLYNQIQANLFIKNSLPDKVIIGNEGWFFLSNEHSNVLLESLGIANFSDEELATIEANILSNKEWLRKKNIDYYVAIAPNKHSIYSEYLPFQKTYNKTPLDQIKIKLSDRQVNFLDLSIAHKKSSNDPLFFKTDSHWNDLGAFWGYKILADKIKEHHAQVLSLNISDFELYKESWDGGDLAKMLNISSQESFPVLKIKNSTASKQPSVLPVPPYFNMSSEYEERYKSSVNNLKVLIFRDSFCISMRKYLAESFGETILIWDYSFNKEIIEQEKPDIVVHLVVERNLEAFL
ncbi:hypothetical protein [Pontibacter sp. SGAir0037]|uniref:alginate O-acetyltransferase AlgX-related protein n=1 Tax=Pontibacter sp. SGAir0037 TaxID=2571030 RepID=UPI0010CD3691|nr:hypothetical protein [Pontibacter sp. SGAir0037]QCR23699.1 hypothetical protein C1N53_16000 [Pontibacter sp. SGAir0037]